jgi:hypothetical protein
VEAKLDTNTKITQEGATAAVTNAKVAASAAVTAATKAAATEDRLVGMLNGSLDDRMHSIVKTYFDPLAQQVRAQAEQGEKNMTEIRLALGELRDRTKAPPAG